MIAVDIIGTSGVADIMLDIMVGIRLVTINMPCHLSGHITKKMIRLEFVNTNKLYLEV